MKNQDACGIYQILCVPSGKMYVGSSRRIYRRWYEHRGSMRRGISQCQLLQRSWTKYGEDAFRFSIIEECEASDLLAREQFHINALKPALNLIHADRSGADAISAKAAMMTHCPRGHAYDEPNTYLGKWREKICRACNALRVSAVYASETPDQREQRRSRVAASHLANRDARRPKQAEYSAKTREQKRDYDRQHRAEMNARRNEHRVNEAPEAREERLRKKRESHHRGLGRADGAPPPRAPMTEEQKAKISASLTGRNLRPRNEPWVALGISKTTYFRRQKIAAPEGREALRAYKLAYYHRHAEEERAKMRDRYKAKSQQETSDDRQSDAIQ